MKKIIILALGLSLSLLADYSRVGNIVTDSNTNLQWQDNATSATMKWQVAIAYCEALIVDNYFDWRLPNFNELYSIIDYNKHSPAISTRFQNKASDRYWSSTTAVGDEDSAWTVHFGDGYDDRYSKRYTGNYVRCVRDGQ